MNVGNPLLTPSRHYTEWVPLLELAAREVFQLMVGCELVTCQTATEAALDTTAMVGMAGQLCGVLSVRCERKAAALMASRMLRIELDKVGAEIGDALGEICNMVAGNFKNKISGLGDGCLLSPPTIVSGKDYSLYSMADSPGLEVRLLFETMPMTITLQIHS